MTTLTVQIMTGRRWYKNSVGRRFDVTKDPARDFRLFYLVDPRALSIDKDDCIVTAVNYELPRTKEGDEAVLAMYEMAKELRDET